MSSKKQEGSSSKKKFPFFNSGRKSKAPVPLATSPSTDNSVKIPAMEVERIQDVISSVVRTYSKKGRKSKAKLKTKPEPDILDVDPAKPKNLAKLFKKYGDREIPNSVRQHVPPKLSPAQSQPSAVVTDADLKSDVSDQPCDGCTVAVDPDDQADKAAVKIQSAFRGLKYRRLYLSSRKKVVKIQALIRGFLTRKHLKTPTNTEEKAEEAPEVAAEEEPEKSNR